MSCGNGHVERVFCVCKCVVRNTTQSDVTHITATQRCALVFQFVWNCVDNTKHHDARSCANWSPRRSKEIRKNFGRITHLKTPFNSSVLVPKQVARATRSQTTHTHARTTQNQLLHYVCITRYSKTVGELSRVCEIQKIQKLSRTSKRNPQGSKIGRLSKKIC